MLHASTRGEGISPVLLLHGFLGTHRNLGALVRGWVARAPEVTTYAADLLGHGRSPPLPEGANLETMATAVLELIASLGLEEPVRTVGHSLGGRVALMARRLAPSSVSPLTLLDITPSPISGSSRRSSELAGVAEALLSAPESVATREQMRGHLARTLSAPIVEWLLMNLKQERGLFRWAIDRRALVDFDRRAGAEDLWDAVDDTVDCIRGSDSPYVSNEDADRFQAAGARVVTMPGAGHFVHVDATEAVLELLTGRARPGSRARSEP